VVQGERSLGHPLGAFPNAPPHAGAVRLKEESPGIAKTSFRRPDEIDWISRTLFDVLKLDIARPPGWHPAALASDGGSSWPGDVCRQASELAVPDSRIRDAQELLNSAENMDIDAFGRALRHVPQFAVRGLQEDRGRRARQYREIMTMRRAQLALENPASG
jgi:hypothetical protein